MRHKAAYLFIVVIIVAAGSVDVSAQVYQGPRSHIERSSIPPTQHPGYRDAFGNGPVGIPTTYYQYNPSPYWNYAGNILSAYIESRCRRNNGLYQIRDSATGATLRLQLRDLQRESLARLDENTFIIGSRFETTDGTPVAVDFLLKPAMRGQWYVAKSEVYKVNDEARYEYEWNGKKWVKVAAQAEE